MADSPMQINALVVDATDPERLAAFWSELLGRPVVARMGPYVWLRREGGLGLGFQRTDEAKSGKNRMHFDITSSDPAAEQRRVEMLGGRRLEQYDGGGFLVMADPEGNEFCIIPEGAFRTRRRRARGLPRLMVELPGRAARLGLVFGSAPKAVATTALHASGRRAGPGAALSTRALGDLKESPPVREGEDQARANFWAPEALQSQISRRVPLAVAPDGESMHRPVVGLDIEPSALTTQFW